MIFRSSFDRAAMGPAYPVELEGSEGISPIAFPWQGRRRKGKAGQSKTTAPESTGMDKTAIEEMFSALGPVTIRRMFGGKGVYHGGRIVAVEVRGEMLLKADGLSAPNFEAAGARRWSYEGKKGKVVNMPYWSIPEDAFDDPDLMAGWVRLAYEAALRSPAG